MRAGELESAQKCLNVSVFGGTRQDMRRLGQSTRSNVKAVGEEWKDQLSTERGYVSHEVAVSKSLIRALGDDRRDLKP